MTELALLPEDRRILAVAMQGVIAARIKFGGRLDRNGLALSGTLSFLSNCGLMKFLGRLQQGEQTQGGENAFLFYSLTEEGRAYLGLPTSQPEPAGKPERSAEFPKGEEDGRALTAQTVLDCGRRDEGDPQTL